MFTPSQLPPLDCESCSELLPRHLSGGLDAPRIARVRQHLADCEACREAYAASAAALAAMGAAHREERLEVNRQLAERRAAAKKDGSADRQRRRSGLRSLLWPSLAVVLLMGVTHRNMPGKPQLSAHAGDVSIDGFRIVPGEAPGELVPGRACWTGPNGEATIRTSKGRAALGSDTVVSYQGSHPLRVRIDRGSLVAEGSARVLFAGGLIELEEASAQVEIDGDAVMLRSLEGEALVLSSEGSRKLSPGEVLRLP